jgi:DNA modification methylase
MERSVSIRLGATDKEWLEAVVRVDVVYCQDCLEGLRRVPHGCAQLVLTSPPYPGNGPFRIKPREFLPWFVERCFAIKRVLAERGSLFLDLNDCVVRGEQAAIVHKVVLTLRQVVGLKLIWTYHWVKPNAMPGAYGLRLKNAHQFVLHFARSARPAFYNGTLMRPYVSGRRRIGVSRTKTGRLMHGARMLRRGRADPGNVFVLAVGGESSPHPTPMPTPLVRKFVQLGSKPGDLVVDPFAGGGTTLVAAR